MSDEYTPTRSEIERAWALGQFQLDEDAGRETDGLRYAAEFRRAFKEFEAAIRRDQIAKDTQIIEAFADRRAIGRYMDEAITALRAQIGDTNEQ